MPSDLKSIPRPDMLVFEEGYGHSIGIPDDAFLAQGARIAPRSEVLSQPVICDAKVGDARYLQELGEGQAVFGWVHAVQNRFITDKLVSKKLTAIAWEDMFEGPRHVFWRNNEIAGEAAVLHAFTLFGRLPQACKVALLGRGNIARGAYRVLTALGAEVTTYGRGMDELLRRELPRYDVVVNGALWDPVVGGHAVRREDLDRMKRPALIIDMSCDRHGTIETSEPTTIASPVYEVEGVLHYAVDHTPALVAVTASEAISAAVAPYLPALIEGRAASDPVLGPAVILDKGRILDERIRRAQGR